MCGIIGYVGKKNSLPILIKGLKSLEYRGYDSSGIAYLKEDKIKIIKEEGKVSILENNVTIEFVNNKCIISGIIVTEELISVPSELIIIEQGETQ